MAGGGDHWGHVGGHLAQHLSGGLMNGWAFEQEQ